MKGFRNKMAEMIIEQGDLLYKIEHDDNTDVEMWLVRDHTSYNNPLGRADQYQVWKGDKRCYVGSNRQCAYADFKKQKEEMIADWAM